LTVTLTAITLLCFLQKKNNNNKMNQTKQ